MKKKNQKSQKSSLPLNMNEMNNEQMMSLLAELADTNFWQAILRFNRNEDIGAVSGLATLDPFKEPTKVARTQGWRNGLYRMEQIVTKEIENRRELARSADKKVK